MEAWTLEVGVGELLLDFCMVGCCLIAGTILRRFVPFFQTFLIPASLIAGFLGLLLGPEALDLIPLNTERMGAYVYHLLALTFICVGLFKTEEKHSWGVVNLGYMQVSIMLLQGIIGLGIALLVAQTLVPDLNPAMGILLPLGFAMGPGIAYSIGESWTAYGFENAGSIGLTFAAVGFLIAYFWGMMMVNRNAQINDNQSVPTYIRTGVREAGDYPVGSFQTFSGAAVEPFAVHVALIGAIYLVTYWVTVHLASGLRSIGLGAEIPVLWSFHFIFANLIALATRRSLLRGTRGTWMDNQTIHRLTGTFAEYLIAASIMAISLSIAIRFVIPMFLICMVGTLATYYFLKWTSEMVFKKHVFERFVGIFAEMTGTISSGLALLKVVDPDFETPVPQELVLSSGMALTFGFPLLILINMPFTLFGGSTSGFVIVLGIMVAYLLAVAIAWYGYVRKKRKDQASD